MNDPRSDSELAVGTRLVDRYTLGRLISRGAMGGVYRARDEHVGEDVAIKHLVDRSQITRFEIEARLLAQLDHPNVVSVLDHFGDQSAYFLVMELVPGEDLNQVLRRDGTPGLPPDRVLDHTAQLCDALQYVHDQGIVHRDVKPQNVVCAERVVLVDFGLARELAREGPGTVAVGTPRFMAPEVFAGGAVSERSDVFSLAVTVWTLLAGSPPAYADRTPLSDSCPAIPPQLERALLDAMEFRPEDRTPSVLAFAATLDRPIDRHGVDLAVSLSRPDRQLLEGIVRTAAGVFDAAAASVALCEEPPGGLTYQAAWGAGAREIVGVRLAGGEGIGGASVETGEPVVVPECRRHPRFAAAVGAGTGYVPNTMLVVPLEREGHVIGVLSLLDRRDGEPYTMLDATRATLFADLATQVLDR